MTIKETQYLIEKKILIIEVFDATLYLYYLSNLVLVYSLTRLNMSEKVGEVTVIPQIITPSGARMFLVPFYETSIYWSTQHLQSPRE